MVKKLVLVALVAAAPLAAWAQGTADGAKQKTSMCIGCHGAGLSGGKIPGGPPDWPAAARLAPGEGSAMPAYKDADAFVAMMRSGKRPNGSDIAVMPFGSLKTMNETDLRALYLYLKQMKAP